MKIDEVNGTVTISLEDFRKMEQRDKTLELEYCEKLAKLNEDRIAFQEDKDKYSSGLVKGKYECRNIDLPWHNGSDESFTFYSQDEAVQKIVKIFESKNKIEMQCWKEDIERKNRKELDDRFSSVASESIRLEGVVKKLTKMSTREFKKWKRDNA